MVNTVQDTFKELVNNENLEGMLFISWAYTEYVIDFALEKEFSLAQMNEEHKKFALRGSFENKWQFVKKLNLFTESEKEKIKALQEKRNKLFHRALFENPEYYSPSGKKALAKIAEDAFYAVSEAFNRNYVRSPV
jgi:hypothetical protein